MRRSVRRRGGVVAWFFLFLLVAAGAAAALFWPGSTGAALRQVDVRDGMHARQVADALRSAGLIETPYPFLFWVRMRHAGPRIQVGRYQLRSGRSAFWLVDDLIAGRTQKIRVTIPEGFASWQIAERLEAAQICSAQDMKRLIAERSWEGFLFPATYDFNVGASAESVGKRMVSEFDRRWTSAMDAQAAAIGLDKKQAVTLASILQREVRVRSEFPIVSAVYHNRLKKGMALDADPTVQYAQGFWNTHLTFADYRNTKSPYNTYLSKGLPPGPICSPGVDALKAALWPANSDALYFVAKGDGSHTFSSTYREHVNKVNRRNRAQRAAHRR